MKNIIMLMLVLVTCNVFAANQAKVTTKDQLVCTKEDDMRVAMDLRGNKEALKMHLLPLLENYSCFFMEQAGSPYIVVASNHIGTGIVDAALFPVYTGADAGRYRVLFASHDQGNPAQSM